MLSVDCCIVNTIIYAMWDTNRIFMNREFYKIRYFCIHVTKSIVICSLLIHELSFSPSLVFFSSIFSAALSSYLLLIISFPLAKLAFSTSSLVLLKLFYPFRRIWHLPLIPLSFIVSTSQLCTHYLGNNGGQRKSQYDEEA